MTTELTKAAQRALDALEEIALAGMSGTGQESEEGMRDWHARQAWKFISIAARALDPLRAALTQHPAAQTEREAFAVARAFALATMASEEFVRFNGLSTGEADEFILTGPDLTDEHATACVEHLKHVGECVAFDCDDGVIVRLGDFTLGSLS